eukprot:7258320-Lingulodinium_polyedra.AAC.1
MTQILKVVGSVGSASSRLSASRLSGMDPCPRVQGRQQAGWKASSSMKAMHTRAECMTLSWSCWAESFPVAP